MKKQWPMNVKYPYRKVYVIDFLIQSIMLLIFFSIMVIFFDVALWIVTSAYLIGICISGVYWLKIIICEYRDYMTDEEITQVTIFSDVESLYDPGYDMIRFLYPRKDSVRRIELVGRFPDSKKKITMRCIGSSMKESMLFDLLLGTTSGYGKKIQSMPFNVTFTKYNHYLVRLDMVEGIDYSCFYEEYENKINQINNTF